MEKIDWFVYLLLFNFIVITFTGFYGGYINQENIDTASSDLGVGLGNANFDLITGFESAPNWLNALFGLQIIILVYLGLATILPGG